MREDSDHFRHYVPLLRRIIIVVAVLAAIPVILWTITVFMRSYVGPPKLPTFRQLAASATVPLPRNASASLDSATQPLPPPEQSRLSDASSAAVPAGATPTDAPDAAAAPKGPLLGDRAPIGAANTPTGALRTAETSPIIPADPKAMEMPAAAAPPEGAAPNTGDARRAAAGGLDRHAGRCRARRGAAVRPDPAAAAPSAPRRHGADDAGDCADATAAAGCRRPGRV